MTPEEKQEIITAATTAVLQQLFGAKGIDITGLSSVQSLDGISTFPAIQSVNGDLALVSVPISLLTQAVQTVIGHAEQATANAQSAAAGWAAAAHKTNGEITIINGNITTLQNADKSLSTLTSYAECSTGADTASKAVTIQDFALPIRGGCLHIKMANANTAASNVTLNINATGAKPLYYNGSAVSATNTWEANEVIEVYYDGNNYQASNARGGGGRADKISFDNTVKDKYESDDVQGVIDEMSDEIDDVVSGVESNTSAITTLNNTTLPTLQSTLQGNVDAIASVYNVTKNHPLQSGSYDIASASAAVPSAKRSVGLIITYQTGASTWEAKQFIGSNVSGWATESNWTDFGGGGSDFVEVTSAQVATMEDPT